jgi:hypothetical protein
MGGPDEAASAIELYNKLNSGDKNQKLMADGIISFPLQMHDDDLEALNAFVNSLTMENGYPCSHRRMKKYLSEVGIDNFTR